MLMCAPLATAARYFWHAMSMVRGSGAAARFRQDGEGTMSLVWIVLRAHLELARSLPRLWRQRREIRRRARISTAEFRRLIRRHSIGAREVAAL
jgi:hypothetical protein